VRPRDKVKRGSSASLLEGELRGRRFVFAALDEKNSKKRKARKETIQGIDKGKKEKAKSVGSPESNQEPTADKASAVHHSKRNSEILGKR